MAANSEAAEQIQNKWQNGASAFELETSGSTGFPKKIELLRNQLEASARITGAFLQIQPDDSIYCCLPVDKIGGMMQIIRAAVWGIPVEIAEPTSNPLKEYSGNHSVTSLTPMQLRMILDNPESKNKLEKFRLVLVGGGPVSATLEQELTLIPCTFYHTYGMTETCSHIAMRRIGKEKVFLPLPEIQLRKNEKDCLEISGEITNHEWITTNDIVVFENEGFRILGRMDSVINSGGIKILAEILEKDISDYLHLPENSILAVGVPDTILGERLVLLVDSTKIHTPLQTDFTFLKNKFHIPKEVMYLKHFLFTETGKIAREKTRLSAL
ncbi:MAG: AMP-binding protein [Bacteroidetes bacterium]|nr:AMP-binding protein [Bacteroidota bacterium]